MRRVDHAGRFFGNRRVRSSDADAAELGRVIRPTDHAEIRADNRIRLQLATPATALPLSGTGRTHRCAGLRRVRWSRRLFGRGRRQADGDYESPMPGERPAIGGCGGTRTFGSPRLTWVPDPPSRPRWSAPSQTLPTAKRVGRGGRAGPAQPSAFLIGRITGSAFLWEGHRYSGRCSTSGGPKAGLCAPCAAT